MNNKLISQLTKTEILKLPGFSDKSKLTVKQLKELLNKSIRRMKINKKGLRVNQYISAYKEMDIEGKIQDFDAVSLYPSAMSIMDGVPKSTPKIIPKDISKEELLKYNQFFAEINITRIRCKGNIPYKFGQLFSRNNEGSKIFNNEPTNHFFIDKIGFKDLMEFYDFDYEFIRGYYFNEGFNDKINKFIEKLFNLRLKYKKQNNPLQSTIILLLNSIYGKSILKAITSEIKCVPK